MLIIASGYKFTVLSYGKADFDTHTKEAQQARNIRVNLCVTVAANLSC